MSKIINFDSKEEFSLYRMSKATKEIGAGSEGVCYLGKDNVVYKDLTDNDFLIEKAVNEIITSDDINLKSFNFPDVLFACDGKLIGYTDKYIKNNLFKIELLFRYGIEHIDFDKLIDAYYVMRNDAAILADKNIKIYDLSYNIMFDGFNLYAIDTAHYEKVEHPVLEYNLVCVDNAIKAEFYMIAEYVFEEDFNNTYKLAKGMNTVEFLNYFKDIYSEIELDLEDEEVMRYLKQK